MNYLAHAYLSFGNEPILLGNMISDYIKGKKKFDYPPPIQQGIQFHRQIDSFTDTHPATSLAKQWLKPAAGAYAGAFIDVCYDHFLATDTAQFPSLDSLQEFAKTTYTILQKHQSGLPQKFQQQLPYMIEQDWLTNYHNLGGTKNAFNGLAHQALYLNNPDEVFFLFEKHYNEIKKCYDSFFKDVKCFATSHLNSLQDW